MENEGICTPTKTKYGLSRSVLADLPATGPRFNLSSSSTGEKYSVTSVTTAAANRLIDFSRGTSQRSAHRRSLSNDSTSQAQHARQWSKAARNPWLPRSVAINRESVYESSPLTHPIVRWDIGDTHSPITHFRPQLWKHLDSSRDTINLDLFWPQHFEDEEEEEEEEAEEDEAAEAEQGGFHRSDAEKGVFPLQGLRPLCEFRSLRSLRLGGMLQSYQFYIWRVCWLNPSLEELILEMALEPSFNDGYRTWAPINGAWCTKTTREARTDYLGQHEDGALSDAFGTGEYLDKNAIASARSAMSPQGVNLRYLPIVKLVLAGFVVDAGPFFRWFNPMKLRQIEFKHSCVDAGFALPSHMAKLVTVFWPKNLRQEGEKITISRVSQQDIRQILLGGKGYVNDQTGAGIRPRMHSILTNNWFSSTRTLSFRSRRVRKDRRPQPNASSQPVFSRQTSTSGSSLMSEGFSV